MEISYNRERLKEILEDFTRITEISITVLDRDFNNIATTYNLRRSAFCEMIQKAVGDEKCRICDENILKKCTESRKAEHHICHAGLTDAAIPLIRGGDIIGYILFGRIRLTDTLDNSVLSLCNGYGHELKKSFTDLVYYSEKQLESLINLAVAVTMYILSDGNIIKSKCDPIAEKATEYIRENLKGDLSVSAICKRLNISKNTLYNSFNYSLNTTVAKYINNLKTEKAKLLLTETSRSIEEIAEECGITDYNYFIKFFKRQCGVTPHRYRKEFK